VAERKADASPVTRADREAEQAIRTVIRRHFPEHDILGEEFGGAAQEDWQARPNCWVIDPLDGTRAFITGRPMFGTLIALLQNGVPVLGLIDQPVTRERWVGLSGQQTRFAGPLGGTIGTRCCTGLDTAELSCTSPDMLGAERPRWQRLADTVARVTWGGDCYAYGLLALGHIDIVAERDMKLWDYAALVPVVEGAGGMITDWRGGPLRPGSDGTVLAAANAQLHSAAVEGLKEGLLF
jgi:myo-inositol-1(or 4)-monophosphatase